MFTSLNYEHSAWRRALFPFYNAHDIVFFLVLIVSGAILIRLAGIESALATAAILLVAYAGAVLNANETSPATLITDTKNLPSIGTILREQGYEERDGTWVPAFRKLTRWPGDSVTAEAAENTVRLRGPFNALWLIQRELSPNDDPPGC